MDFEVRGVCFCNGFLKILQFYVINPKLGQKGSKLVFHIPTVKSKSYFQVNYSFMKPFSQNFDVLTQCCDVINPELARKSVQTGISCTNGDRIINYLTGTLR